MPFDGAGHYNPPPAAPYPAVGGTTILASQFNTVINDIATALSNCITRDGQSPATANIPLGGFKLTGVGAPGATNDALTFGTAGTMTTLTASTSVVTPLVDTGAADPLQVKVNGTIRWNLGGTSLFPQQDNTLSLGGASNRYASVFTPIIDSGTTGSLSLKTNNGSKQFELANAASVNWLQATGSASASPVLLGSQGSDSNIPIHFFTQGSGAFNFATVLDTATQFQILHTASANRNITVTGSNGGNPTIGVTAGSLAIAPSVLIAGAFLQIGSTSALTGALRVPYGASGNGGLAARLQDNSGDQQLIDVTTQNSVTNVVFVGASIGGPNNSNGVVLRARSGAGAPTTSDIPAGDWVLWRDTSGATTKLYYNNAGSIQSVALA